MKTLSDDSVNLPDAIMAEIDFHMQKSNVNPMVAVESAQESKDVPEEPKSRGLEARLCPKYLSLRASRFTPSQIERKSFQNSSL